jgi:predicted phosphodiesterase
MKIIGDIDIIGDTHGVNSSISRWAKLGNTTNLIHVGDYGIGFKGMHQKTILLGDELNANDKNVYVIRGNHDDPSFFDGRRYGGEYGGITFVKDGTVAEWQNRKILFNGGAISIDRYDRINEISYWEGEGFKPVECNEEIDYLITHSSFSEVTSFPLLSQMIIGFSQEDQDLVSDLNEEQILIKDWVDNLIEKQKKKIKYWYYGHFHNSYVSNYKGIECVCLNIEEIKPLSSALSELIRG